MSYQSRIAEVEAKIDAALAEVAKSRAIIAKRSGAKRRRLAGIGELLASIALLKAERARLQLASERAPGEEPAS